MTRFIVTTCHILILICPGLLQAQAEHFEFDHLSVQQGLSHSVVTCILQDRKGFMWFGTLDGLNRYDGYTVNVYRHDPLDSNSLTHNVIGCLYEDHNGLLWVGTKGGGLNIFDPETGHFHKWPLLGQKHNEAFIDIINTIRADHTGIIWVGTSDGLIAIEPELSQVTYYHADTTNPTTLHSNAIQNIHEDYEGTLWVATLFSGLHRLDRSTGHFSVYEFHAGDSTSLSDANAISLSEASDKSLWIGTWMGGLNKFDKMKHKFYHYPKSSVPGRGLNDNTVRAISEDESGRLWLATAGGGINLFDRRTNSFSYITHDPSNPSSLAGRDIRTFYKDRSGNLWIATDDGINKLVRKRFGILSLLSNSSGNLLPGEVSAISEDGAGDLWVASYVVGLNRFMANGNTVVHYKHRDGQVEGPSSNFVIQLYSDRTGTLWIGSAGGGLNRFDRLHDRFEVYRHDQSNAESLSSDFVHAILEDHEGNFWVGTNNGLDKLDRIRNTFSHYRHEPGSPQSLGDDNVSSLAEDSSGSLWIGTSFGGLSVLDRTQSTFTHYTHHPGESGSLASNNVSIVYFDGSGRLWVGTASAGLDRFDPMTNTFHHFTTRDGMPSDGVRCILGDDHGYMWIGTSNGLSKFDPSTKLFRNYDSRDGLPDNQFLSCYKSKTGKMFFGGPRGINIFYPDSVANLPIFPSVVLTSFKVFNEPFPLPKPLESATEILLDYRQNFISFEFAALDYTSPEKNQYAYKLDGVDPDWTYCGSRRFANYTHLDPGKYVFLVKGSISSGMWSDQGVAIPVIITPPFWATWWFRLLIFLVIVGTLTAAYRYRVNKLLELERMRLRIARDLHDELGSNLSGIALASEMVQASPILAEADKRRLMEVGQKALETAEAMRDIVWFINPEHDSPGNIVLKMKDVASSVLNGIRVSFHSSENPLPKSANIEFRRDIFLIYKETLNNIVRHSRCSAVDIRMENIGGNFILKMSDNGIGFDPHGVQNGSGLKNITARAGRLGGDLKIESIPGRGTSVTLLIQTT